jgi:hypothetical protein
MTVQIDDAGVGDLLDGVVIGAYRLETGEFAYEMVDVEFFQQPRFGRKAYLEEASGIVMKITDRMRLTEDEPLLICSSYIFEKAVRELQEKYGKERVTVTKITGEAQRFVETAYLDEVRNLGYEPLPERDEKRARNFFHMLRWVKKDPSRFKHAKTGWPRLKRYIGPRGALRTSPSQPDRRAASRRRGW